MSQCEEKETKLHGSDFHFIIPILVHLSWNPFLILEENIKVCRILLKSTLFYIFPYKNAPEAKEASIEIDKQQIRWSCPVYN